jgi:Flp pilus assembly protein TadD
MFEQVIDLAPNHGYAWNNLGFACLLANENEAAVDALTHAAELLPGVAYVHNNLGIALERTGRLDQAMRAFIAATELSPKYVKAKLNLQRLEQLASTGEMPDQQELDDASADAQSGIKSTLP